ncbi:MAG: methionine adenosyltransferase [Clostridia bacterium]|nr:methionine adenosyltransferase [Clostridia bacterium]
MEEKVVLFSSESVTEGHPDKVCDRISDSVLDAIYAVDPTSRVACEVCATTGLVVVMGEITTSAKINVEEIARNAIKEIGYTDESFGLDYKTCKIIVTLDNQSSDIAMGVNNAVEAREGGQDIADITGAGDQGMMFGYACRETEELMPLPIMLSHKLTQKLTQERKSGRMPFLRPDGKAQVTVAYRNGKPEYVDTVVVSTQHSPEVERETLVSEVIEKIIKAVIDENLINEKTKYLVNPTGNFVIGGPQGDSGLTGRKIIVDTYGGMCPHGGGAFSGKDPTKVDRSACYYARYACKNVVASGLADRCQIQVAYAIGKAKPVSLNIDTFGTGNYPDEKILEAVNKVFDFRPYSIIEGLQLRRPIYKQTSAYGHFGNPQFPWENTDKVDELIKAIKE